ncbi:MAG: serine hydrolase [Pseudomonadota bacterium]
MAWIKRIGLAFSAILVLGAAAALVKREELGRLMAVQSLFDPDRIVANFSNMDRAFLSTPLPATPGPALPSGPETPLPEGAETWIEDRLVTALVVLHDGRITYESYYRGTDTDDQRMSWSVAKSFLSLLTGIVIEDGMLDLTDPVTQHAPILAGAAYEGVTVRDVLQMQGGVAFDEDYFDPGSDINRMGRQLALGRSLDDFAAALTERARPAGRQMVYNSMDTHVLSLVLRGATGRSIPDLMAEKLTGPLGTGPAYYLVDGDGAAFVLGGLNMTTRDYARMGLMVAQGGMLDGRRIVPEAWISESTEASANTPDGAEGYGYKWWLPADARPGEVYAHGVYGQYVYIDRARNVVIAANGVDPLFQAPGTRAEFIAMFRRIAEAQGG